MNRHLGFVKGFSFVELLVVLAILGVLATMAAPLAELTLKRQKEQELRSALREIRTAIDAYKRDVDAGRVARLVGTAGYPPTLESLVDGAVDQLSPSGRRIYYLRRLPTDPFAGTELVGRPTWGLRSYQSSAVDPQPGSDVFDVYSKSDAVALDGTKYRDW